MTPTNNGLLKASVEFGASGRDKRALRPNPLLALGVCLALATAGCVGPVDSEEDEENIAAAAQELDPVDGEDGDDEGDLELPGDDAEMGDENGDPQPQPWRAEDDDPGPDPGPDPLIKTMSSTPSGHGK